MTEMVRVAASALVLAGILLLMAAMVTLITATVGSSPEDPPRLQASGRIAAWGIPGMVLLAAGAYLHASASASDEEE